MYGWRGKILKINLSDRAWNIESEDPEILKQFIGGRGLSGYFIREKITLDWNHPDMPLLFFSGPLVDTRSPTSGRMTVLSRSPLTGAMGDSSVGGSFATQLKKAGYDGIVITGKSDTLCGIEIIDQTIQIVDASHLLDREIGYVQSILKGKGATAIIGPAAENGVLFSSIIIDRHYAAGRSGIGLIMASKNLKYLTVKGGGKTKIFDPEALKSAREDVFRLAAASPVLLGEFGISRFGTGALYDLMDARHMMPTDNFRRTRFEAASRMNAHAFKKRYHPKKTGCRGCHILCKQITSRQTSIPEFETMSHFSALLGNKDIKAVVAANRLCNEMGMDTISAAATLACFSEISGKKLSSHEIIAHLKDIARGKGIGVELGQGAAKYAARCGRSDLAMAVKGQELPAYDPRGAYGMALAYATSSRGGCHLRAYPVSHEILRKPVATDRFTFKGKARMIKIGEDFVVIAGPCSVESEKQTITTAQKVKEAGADMLRGGAFKPRTSPYAFQGLGLEGLKILEKAKKETGLPIVSEVIDPRDVSWVSEYVDVLQIGARNMQNFSLLREVGRVKKPVLLKRGMHSTITEWLNCAEYILAEGNPNVILCERGIRTFETYTRNTLDLSMVPATKEVTHLPIIVDPSHGTGRLGLIESMSLASVAAGADGLILEVHCNPAEALSDGDQSMDPPMFTNVMKKIRKLYAFMPELENTKKSGATPKKEAKEKSR